MMKKIIINDTSVDIPEAEDSPKIMVIADGGTIAVTWTDPAGGARSLYLDRRIETETFDNIFAGAYPGGNESIDLGHAPSAVAEINALAEMDEQ